MTPTWRDILLSYPIYDRVCHFLTRVDIVNLKATSKQIQGPIDTLLKNQWDINRLLKRFVDNPIGLRQRMADYDALISGSFALQFFDRVVWEESDLDVYVEGNSRDPGPISFCEYLISEEGYILNETKDMEEYEDAPISIYGVKTFTRPSARGTADSRVQIICTTKLPILVVLGDFYTTALVNVITWNKAYSVFPDVTFKKRKTYQLRPMTPLYGSLLMKYSRRGWRTLGTVWNDDTELTKSLVFKGQRRIGDSKSWKIDLNIDGLTPHILNSSNLDYSFFRVTQKDRDASSRDERPESYYEVEASEFKSCVLQQKYTFANFTPSSFSSFLGSRLEQLTEIERCKQPGDVRSRFDLFVYSAGYSSLYRYADDLRADVPDGWSFWDDEIPRWYTSFQKDAQEKLRLDD